MAFFAFIVLAVFHMMDLTQSILTKYKETQIHSGEITDLQFTSDFSMFATISSSDNKFIIWNSGTLQKISQKTVASKINGIGLNSASNETMVLMKNGSVDIYDTATLTLKGSYNYPNSGYGVQITFISGGEYYMIGGLDPGFPPCLHIFTKNHTYLTSLVTGFSVGSEIDMIYNAANVMIFVISNQGNYPAAIQMYSPVGTNYVLNKKFYDANAKITGISISADGKHLYTVSQDLTLRNYSLSTFDQKLQVTSVTYYSTNPLAVNGLVDVVTFVSTETEIIEYFRTGEIALETHYPTSSGITVIINLYPQLLCLTRDGKMIVYGISFFDGVDRDMTKWIVLTSVMGSLIFVLFVGLIIEITYNRIKLKAKEEEQEKLKPTDM